MKLEGLRILSNGGVTDVSTAKELAVINSGYPTKWGEFDYKYEAEFKSYSELKESYQELLEEAEDYILKTEIRDLRLISREELDQMSVKEFDTLASKNCRLTILEARELSKKYTDVEFYASEHHLSWRNKWGRWTSRTSSWKNGKMCGNSEGIYFGRLPYIVIEK